MKYCGVNGINIEDFEDETKRIQHRTYHVAQMLENMHGTETGGCFPHKYLKIKLCAVSRESHYSE